MLGRRKALPISPLVPNAQNAARRLGTSQEPKLVRKHCKKYSDKTKHYPKRSEVNKWDLFRRYSTLKASLPVKALSFDPMKQLFFLI